MNVLINLLLPLKGCVVDNVSSHAKIGGDFFHFNFLKKKIIIAF
jgi:hypothetical protein